MKSLYGLFTICNYHAVNATVGYSNSAVNIQEGQTLALLRIEIFSPSGGAPQPFTLTVNTEDGTASLCVIHFYAALNRWLFVGTEASEILGQNSLL